MIVKLTTITVQYEYYDSESEPWSNHNFDERINDADFDTSSEEHRIILSREIVNELFD
jgi:hypothetical protein